MRQLPVHFIGNCPFLQHHDYAAGNFRQGREMHVDMAFVPDAGAAEIDPVFVDRRLLRASLRDKGQDRRGGRQEIVQTLSPQGAQARLEEDLRSAIAVDDRVVAVECEDRIRQGVQQALGIDAFARRRRLRTRGVAIARRRGTVGLPTGLALHSHAATRASGSSQTPARRRATSWGSSLVARRARTSASILKPSSTAPFA